MKDKEKTANTAAILPAPFIPETFGENSENSVPEKETIDYSGDPHRTESGSYRQNWTIYNQAKENELENLQNFLFHLSRIPQEEKEQERGQPRIDLSTKLFVTVLRAYFPKLTGRRLTSFLNILKDQGYIDKVPSRNVVTNFIKKKTTTEALKDMLAISSLPLVPLEKDFAADSTGFATYTFAEYRKKKYGDSGVKRIWR